MAIVIDGTTGISAVQDGIISESKIATGAVTDTKLTLTPNSQEIKDALNATGSAPIYACRAWVNFNGTGTVAIRASGNVSSITDVGVGIYIVNFTTAMSDANYAVSVNSKATSSYNGTNDSTGTPDTNTIAVVHTEANVQVDCANMFVAIFR